MAIPDHLEATVRTLPTAPGCYLYYNAKGDVIYVGKAVNLRNRVRSYFNPTAWLTTPKTGRLVREIARIEFVVRGSELEALIQEAELIKQHKPRYNIRLKDDKRYPYLKVTWQDDFPTVMVTRRIDRDGARYYGPYSDAKAVYATRDTLRRIFPFLNCDRVITGQDSRACMYYDIKLCSGPCVGAVQRAEYRRNIQRLCDFLEGKSERVIREIRSQMDKAAEAMQFERAADFRDRLRALMHVVEKQRIVSSVTKDQDVIAFAREDGDTCVQVLFIRGGKLLGQEHFVLDGAEGEDEQTVLESFLKQFYGEAAYVPPEVLLPAQIEEANIIENWLRQRRGDRVHLQLPSAKNDEELVALAKQNAAERLAVLKAQWSEDTLKQEGVLRELQEQLDLPKLPTRIECFDISNTQGTAIVAAMAVFVHGVPKKSDYRRFNIRDIDGPNDFESMRQALRRRFQRWRELQARPSPLSPPSMGSGTDAGAEPVEAPSTPSTDSGTDSGAEPVEARPSAGSGRVSKDDSSFAVLPDLLLIDGGKGQLGVAHEVLHAFDLAHIVPVASLAKREEEVFKPGRAQSIMLPRRSQAFYLVQRVRDEAHRFGITSHRRQREKIGMASQLDAIKGVGPLRRRKLLSAFGSLAGVREATEDQLAEVVPADVARHIKATLG